MEEYFQGDGASVVFDEILEYESTRSFPINIFNGSFKKIKGK